MKGLKALVALLLAVLLCGGCDPACRKQKDKRYDKVLILYSAGFNSLSDDLLGDIAELKKGDLPASGDNQAIILISHHPVGRLQYGTKTKPAISRLYRDKKGNPVLDTLLRLDETDLLTKPEVMTRTLNYVAEKFKADHYGLILASHGTGWLPAGFYADPDNYNRSSSGSGAKAARHFVFPSGPVPYVEPEPMPGPRVRSYGEEIVSGNGQKLSYEMDIKDLATAIPFHFDYILMDVCLMGCVEVAYELRNTCDQLGFSPTEILADGLVYTKAAAKLLKAGDPDLTGILDDYYDCYAAQSGDYKSACYSLIDCSKLDALASACKTAFEDGRSDIAKVKPSSVQPLFRSYHHWFYDLKDILDQAGVPSQAVEKALNDCVVYKVHTDSFMPRSGGFDFRVFCGMSMYLPCNGSDYLDEYYKTLSWNKATSLVQ